MVFQTPAHFVTFQAVKRFHPSGCNQQIFVVPESFWTVGRDYEEYMDDYCSDLGQQYYDAQLEQEAAEVGLTFHEHEELMLQQEELEILQEQLRRQQQEGQDMARR